MIKSLHTHLFDSYNSPFLKKRVDTKDQSLTAEVASSASSPSSVLIANTLYENTIVQDVVDARIVNNAASLISVIR